jgi:hypothetical protein
MRQHPFGPGTRVVSVGEGGNCPKIPMVVLW